MLGIPPLRRLRFYERKWIVELIASVPPVAAAIVAALVNLKDPDKRIFGIVLLASALWLILGAALKVRLTKSEDQEPEETQEYEGLEGALHTLYYTVRKACGLSDTLDRSLRATIHRVMLPGSPNEAADEFEQILPYMGGDRTGEGRRFSVRSGVVGRAIRNGQICKMERHSDSYEAYVRDLVDNWGYPERDARRLSADRYAWLAAPIFGASNSVVAVVYLDAASSDLFSEAVVKVVVDASAGVASFIRERYGQQ